MEFKHNWSFRSFVMLALLTILPNIFGLVNITLFGFKIHLFQYMIFLAAIIFGPYGGLAAGAFGSVYSAILLGNPYIIIGNMILGFFTGLFVLKGMSIVKAVLFAFAIQLPWLIFSDVLIVGMPARIVGGIVIALLISNIIWSIASNYSYKSFQRLL